MCSSDLPCPVQGKIGENAKEIWIAKGRIKEEDVIQTSVKQKEEPIRESGESK